MASKKILVQEDFVHVNSGSNPAAGFLAFYPKSDNNFYLRTSAGVERKIWDSGNHGPGSGLNADLLDGLHKESFILNNDSIFDKNLFTTKHLYRSDLDDAMFLADIRWVVFGKFYNKSDDSFVSDISAPILSYLFNGNYDQRLIVPAGQYAIINIKFTTETNGLFPGFPYGTFYATHYYTYHLESFTAKVYCNYEPQGVGWKTLTTYDVQTGIQTYVVGANNQYYQISEVEFTITAKDSNDAFIASLEWKLNRPSVQEFPVVVKWKENILYKALTFSANNNINIRLNPNGSASFSGQLTSTAPTGTAPFVIASTTLNTNLNADLLDGYHASSFALSSHTHAYLPLSGGTMSNTNLVTNLNADLLDGQHASAFAHASHNHSFAGLSDVALVSPSAGHTLVYNGSAWVNNSQIRSVPGAEYNTIYIRSADISSDFGDSEMYMTAEEGIYFRTNIGKATAAEASFDQYGIRSSKLMGTGERYLAAGSDGLIKVATVQPTQYWHRDAGNYILSPIESYDEVYAWLFKAGAGGILMADGYLETNRAGIYTSYNDMVVSEYYLLNNTFYYANSKLAFNNSTNLLTVSGGIDAGSNLIAAGEVKLTKQTPGGVLRLQSYASGPDFLRQQDYAGAVIFEAYNGSGYSGVATISARASQNHSGSGMGTNMEFWNYPDGGSNTRPAMILREDGVLDNYFGFAVSGSDGQSGTATILTGCSYNSVTKTLIYTRASVTFAGGIVTSIASMSSLSVPLS
ncbi:hypothetical protein SDC9_36958 [bioreactor metagenome]|uniref:Uncharacterized protein n=1 Tax=bioreactor metagenome TaxID=1076179 RepID=A0A644VI12_9ZZZZ|nr:hypothetical protein [Lentimicrobium sp.]MEA5110361.1 hypothetical protein [Lentimicrobium sp.]